MTNVNPLVFVGMLAAGIGIAWAVTREGEAKAATTTKPTWMWAATNVTPEGEGDVWEVWIEEPNKPAYPMGVGGTDFASYEQAKAAAIQYITARGAIPFEKVV